MAAVENIKVILDSDIGPVVVMVNHGPTSAVSTVVAHVGSPPLVYNGVFLNL